MTNRRELDDAFGTHLPPEVATELQHIQRLLDVGAQELFFKWESYVIKMGVDTTRLDAKTLHDFKKDLQDALERESRAKTRAHHGLPSAAKKSAATPRARAGAGAGGGAGGGGGDVLGMLDGIVSATPARTTPSALAKRKAPDVDFTTPLQTKSAKSALNSSPSSHTPTRPNQLPVVPFEDRPNAGKIDESLNPDLPAAVRPPQPPPESRVKLKANVELPKFAYKNMAMKLSEASEILDDRIDAFTELVQSHHHLSDHAFGNPAAQSTAEVVAVGRIAGDQPNGRLNAASLVLETSRRMGAGLRVPLRFAPHLGYDLFPGKVVALRGTNVSGEYFSVTEILPMPLLGPPASTPTELDIHNDRLTASDGDPRPLHMLVASGPYTTDTDLTFAPLHALLTRASDQLADVLILCGPFLDLEHPIVASETSNPTSPTLTDVFRALISEPLTRLVQAVPTITVILVPSTRDAISKHVSWPQDRLVRGPLGLPRQVQVVTNPILVSINEMIVGISTQDVLSELRRDNVHRPTKGAAINNDVMDRLTRHVIEQRHFFPVFPPQAREDLPKPTPIPGETPSAGDEERLSVGASLDIGYLKLGEWITVKPDLLILPSVLNPFVKVPLPVPPSLSFFILLQLTRSYQVIEGITSLNPGTLSKRRSAAGGTFAALNVLPRVPSEAERAEGAPVAHEVYRRARVDVVRI
ncbi:DNA polymerase alpha subunit B-like [Teratosphaeria destructans]|uniref:DNA polymerase alpha subunit B n=1 Tax=Teratosphaeria destructans TaxID=418781 RepID=A0A9W7W2S8_9PEZI|nr:DNA polymerase alpha subunit B-like [Teratosphaeria destructans]